MFGKFKNKINSTVKGSLSILGIFMLAVIAIVILSYFHVSLQSVIEDPNNTNSVKNVVQSQDTQNNVNYVINSISNAWNDLWDNYLSVPFTSFYNNIWLTYIWHPFIDNMQRIHNAQPTDFDLNAPTVYNPQ